MAVKKSNVNAWLIIGAIGVVFGDIGTSPLYALQAIFSVSQLQVTSHDIIGTISLIIWAITLVVTVKYVGLVMRANNNGEGGIMALIALMNRTKISQHRKAFFVLIGLVGLALFYGDSVITPAISVMSAVEGMRLVHPDFTPYVIPITLAFLVGLFALQSRGTGSIGKLFGPVMLLWFVVSAVAGFIQILQHPAILTALLPTVALSFFFDHPVAGFLAMGAVILAVTGVEALYSDMGHFGRATISRSWLFIVFPALLLTYLGQGALATINPKSIHGAYFLMFAPELRLPAIILATAATLIASQSVISGAFSLTQQAVQLGFLPRLTVKHTSTNEFGQVYLPFINWLLAALVILTVLFFQSSENLAGAYGFAVAGALAVDTLFLLVIMHRIWHYPLIAVIASALTFISIDLLFLSSSISKLLHGAWMPIIIAAVGFSFISTWYKGHYYIARERKRAEGTLKSFVTKLHHSHVPRIPGNAIYLGHHPGNAPLALHESLEQLYEMHENVLVVTVEVADKPHIPEQHRAVFDGLGHPNDGISHITLRFGYQDIPNVPRALALARGTNPEFDFDPFKATYFSTVTQPVIIRNHRMAKWRKSLYLFMQRNANNPTDYYKIPIDQTVEMRAFLEL